MHHNHTFRDVFTPKEQRTAEKVENNEKGRQRDALCLVQDALGYLLYIQAHGVVLTGRCNAVRGVSSRAL